MRPILALAAKDLRLMSRNRAHLFFAFGWPLVVAVFFGLLFGGPRESAATLKVALVDEDGTEASQAFADRLAKTDGLTLSPMARADALTAVRRGTLTGAVIVTHGFGEASARPFFGVPAEISLAMDPSRRAEAAMLEGIVTGAGMQGMERLFTDTSYSKTIIDDALRDLSTSQDRVEGRDQLARFLGELRSFVDSPAARPRAGSSTTGDSAWKPVVVTKTEVATERHGPRNAFMVTFPQGVLWGVIGCAFSFALSLVIERTRGTLTRLQMSPLARAHVLAGKALACFLTILAVQALLFLVARAALGVVPDSWPLLALGSVCLAIAFVGLMMVISVLGRTEQTVGGTAWALLLPLSMLGGGMIPLFAMPSWMLPLSNVSPVKWGILALEGALWRGFSPAEMLAPCAILVAVGVAGFAIGARVFSRT